MRINMLHYGSGDKIIWLPYLHTDSGSTCSMHFLNSPHTLQTKTQHTEDPPKLHTTTLPFSKWKTCSWVPHVPTRPHCLGSRQPPPTPCSPPHSRQLPDEPQPSPRADRPINTPGIPLHPPAYPGNQEQHKMTFRPHSFKQGRALC